MHSSRQHPEAQASFTLPEDLSRVLDAAFGPHRVEHVAPLIGGLSGATLLTVRVDAKDYVVRQSGPAQSARATREAECLRIASALGVAPRLHYYDAQARVSILDKIETLPPGAARPPGRLGRVAENLAKLHQGPAFPPGSTQAVTMRLLEDALRARGASGLAGDLREAIDRVGIATARFAESAPCHNDLNPGNVLETEDRVYFVDWETAGAGDPFVDLAQLGVFAFPTVDARRALLEAYLGRRPTDEERARATLSRVTALAFYAAAFVVMSAETTEASPDPLTMPELLGLLGRHGSRAPAGVVAASLLAEMRREVASDGFETAWRALAI